MTRLCAYIGMALLLGSFSATAAFAQQTPIDGVGFKLGDDLPTVKAAMKTEFDPEPMERNPALPATTTAPNKEKSVLHLRTKGIWAFFNPGGKVSTIRLDAPFDLRTEDGYILFTGLAVKHLACR